jgi:hypothetical protein
MSKLTVVYLKDTGHVLAALTRADPPAAAEPASALVNKGLPLSAVDVTAADITVPVANLASVTVDDDQPEVLTSPQNFQVVQDPQGQAPPQIKNVGVQGSTVSVAIDHTSGATVTVTNVPSATSLPAVVVLQKVTSPSLPPTILAPVTITVGSSGTVVSDQTGFVAGDKWNVYAFVQSLLPKASAALVVA